MKIYVPNYTHGAGRTIYNGYANAWAAKGYEVERYDSAKLIEPESGPYEIMATDGMIRSHFDVDILASAARAYLHVQPSHFPEPWGQHPNFVTGLDERYRKELAGLSNLTTWTFMRPLRQYFQSWGDREPMYVPLAFDNIGYDSELYDKNYSFDVAFIGGKADNGFGEKWPIMVKWFAPLKDFGFKCGIFIEKNLTHEVENKILVSSKICLNVHDAYQQKLGRDTSERTFKALGLNGILVSDWIDEISDLGLPALMARDPEEFITQVKHFGMTGVDGSKVRRLIKENHTYTNRVEALKGGS